MDYRIWGGERNGGEEGEELEKDTVSILFVSICWA